MKRTVITAFCSIFIVALAVAQNAGNDSAMNGDAAQQVKQLEQQIRGQVVKGDTSGLERYESSGLLTLSYSRRFGAHTLLSEGAAFLFASAY